MNTRKKQIGSGLGILATVFALAACGGDSKSIASNGSAEPAPAQGMLPQGGEPVQLDPASFSIEIDNPYWPMSPGSKWVYTETDAEGTRQKVVITVTDKTKVIANGIEARVVRDVVTENGKPVEITDDWYA